jgi:hypothetical protein
VQPNPAGNVLPTVTITAPTNGALVAPGTPLNLTATASDPDGTISRVEFYANGVKLGQDTSASYSVAWTPILVGTYAIVAIAVDNVGGMAASAPVNLTVSAQITTVTLQRGLGGFTGASDTFLNATAVATPYGASNPLYLDGVNYTPLVRFAIFQSDGGPVPNGAVIQSAKLELYKQYYDNTLQLNALYKSWVESQATWLNSQTGVSWSAGGAAGAGTDFDPAADALVAGNFNPGWVAFDVTARTRQWSNTAGTNFGWRLTLAVPNSVNAIQFNSSEYSADTTLRPKLTVAYAPPPTGNIPPSVTLTSPVTGASTTLGGSFALAATAGDVDGTVAKVEFLANGAVVGQKTTTPYSMTWTPPAAGSYTLTARATDNVGAMTTSNAAVVTVTTTTTTTVVMQRGLNGYAGVSDTFLDNYLRTTVRGATNPLYLDGANYTPLARFAVFQSEGGPVPNGAVIQSAKLELYKQYYDGTLQLNALLKPWVESQATWLNSQTGVAWSVGGAAGAGTDYATTNDALVSVGFNPGWVVFDVTPRVQTWSSGTATIYGWRLKQTAGGSINAKQFNSSEYSADPMLRPKLTVVY